MHGARQRKTKLCSRDCSWNIRIVAYFTSNQLMLFVLLLSSTCYHEHRAGRTGRLVMAKWKLVFSFNVIVVSRDQFVKIRQRCKLFEINGVF